MTTEQIRKRITVTRFDILDTGIFILYLDKSEPPGKDNKVLRLAPIESIIALRSIGSINKFEANPIMVWWDTPKGTSVSGTWYDLCATFVLSQYEAITLVVLHLYEESLKSDINLLEMDKALEALR
jgi:hypothetical protein